MHPSLMADTSSSPFPSFRFCTPFSSYVIADGIGDRCRRRARPGEQPQMIIKAIKTSTPFEPVLCVNHHPIPWWPWFTRFLQPALALIETVSRKLPRASAVEIQ
jgi:hypothetical protein